MPSDLAECSAEVSKLSSNRHHPPRRHLRNMSHVSHPPLRSRQFGPVQTQFLTCPPNGARIKNLMRAAHQHLRLSPLTMTRHVRMARAALLLVSIKAATMLGQPFPKLLPDDADFSPRWRLIKTRLGRRSRNEGRVRRMRVSVA
jgi:hypothetical protein